MPTIIGNSTIQNTGTVTGPTGPQGPQGPTGPVGIIGETGNTGSTGVYIFNTSKNANQHLIFNLSNGILLYSGSGFTGPTGTYSNVSGKTYTSPGFLSLFKQVDGGKTLQFRGISGSSNVTVQQTSDKTALNISFNGTPGSAVYGNTLPNYLIYSTDNYSATSSKIGITSGILIFGLTGTDGNTGNSVKVFSDFNEKLYTISSVARNTPPSSVPLNDIVVAADDGGLTVNLKKYSTYFLQAPIGITSFVCDTNTNILQSYTFFINGEDVWNLPNNVYFENTDRGIGKYDLLQGMNIINLWTTNGGICFNASIVERGIGPSASNYSNSIGSCCYSGGTSCLDYTTPSICEGLGGIFNSLKNCDTTCGVFGSCCILGNCYDNIEQSLCTSFDGQFRSQTCAELLCPPVIRVGACCGQYGTCVDNVQEQNCNPSAYFHENKTCAELSAICGPNTLGTCGEPINCVVYSNVTRSACDGFKLSNPLLNFYPNSEPIPANQWPGCATGNCCASDATNPTNPTWACYGNRTKPQCDDLGAGANKASSWHIGVTDCNIPGPSNCVNQGLNFGACCVDPTRNAGISCIRTTQADCTNTYFGTWYQGIPCASNICDNYPIVEYGSCCVGDTCQVTTQANCTALGGGSWQAYNPCTSSTCLDTNSYDFTTTETNGTPLTNIYLNTGSNPYTKTFNIVVSSNSPNQFRLTLPTTIVDNGVTYTVTRSTGNNNTLLNSGAVIPVTISVSANTNLIGRTILLTGTIININNLTVKTKQVNVVVGLPIPGIDGCSSCSQSTNTAKIQLEGTIKRYCLDCQKFDSETKTLRPYPVKEQKIYANVCVDKNTAVQCGWGITLDCVTYGAIDDVWDCRYSSSSADNGIANSTFFNCPHVEYGPDTSNLSPYGGFWEKNKRRTGSGTGFSCSVNPDTTDYTNSSAIPLTIDPLNPGNRQSGNYWRIRISRQNNNCSSANPTSNNTAKGAPKIYSNGGSCNNVTLDPYYSEIEWAPNTTTKLGNYFTSSVTNTRLNNISTRILNLEINDGKSVIWNGSSYPVDPKLAFNPDRQYQSVSLNSGDWTCCSGLTLSQIENSGRTIFLEPQTPGKTTKYLLFLIKKSTRTTVTNTSTRTTSTNTTSPNYTSNGYRAEYSLAVVKMVFNPDNTFSVIDSCSTNFLSGQSQFPWKGNGYYKGARLDSNCADCSYTATEVLYAGYPTPLWDAMLIGEVKTTDLDGSGNLVYQPVTNYDSKNADESYQLLYNDIRYEPNIDNYWKNISKTKPKFTPFSTVEEGHMLAYRFKKLYSNSVECAAFGSKQQTICVNNNYTASGCLIPDDQYASASNYCETSLTKSPVKIFQKIMNENPYYNTEKIDETIRYTVKQRSSPEQNKALHALTFVSGYGAESSDVVIFPAGRNVSIEAGNAWYSSAGSFSGFYTNASAQDVFTEDQPYVIIENWLNNPNQKYSITSTAYVNGLQIDPSGILGYYGDTPIVSTEFTTRKRPDGVVLTQPFELNPSISVTATRNTSNNTILSASITVRPNLFLQQSSTEVSFQSGSMIIQAWLVNPNYQDDSGVLLNGNNSYVKTGIYTGLANTTVNLAGGNGQTVSLNTTKRIGGNDIGIPTRIINGQHYGSVVVHIWARADINDSFGNVISDVNSSGTAIPRTREIVKILQFDFKVDGTLQSLNDIDVVQNTENDILRLDSPVIQNRLINNNCIALDCNNNELLCANLTGC